MEEIAICNICVHQFDNLHFIPKILECGHTFCSPCLTKVFQNSPICPNCRTKIRGVERSLPINFTALKAVEIYKSVNLSERRIVASIEETKKKCIEERDKFSKKKDILDECVAKLEELTVSESLKVDSVNAKKILNEVQDKLQKHGKLQKSNFVLRSADSEISISIRLSSFEDSDAYLREIFERVKTNKDVFAVHKIGCEAKYGKISHFGVNQFLFHSLTLLEAPKDSTLILFDELKQCSKDKFFYTFINVGYNKTLNPLYPCIKCDQLVIKMFEKQMSYHFINLCTGQYGYSFKEISYRRGDDKKFYKSIVEVENFIEDDRQMDSVIDFNYNEENEYYFNAGEICLRMCDPKGGFGIFHVNKNVRAESDIIGRVISPRNIPINYESSPFYLKIYDTGIIINFEI